MKKKKKVRTTINTEIPQKNSKKTQKINKK